MSARREGRVLVNKTSNISAVVHEDHTSRTAHKMMQPMMDFRQYFALDL